MHTYPQFPYLFIDIYKDIVKLTPLHGIFEPCNHKYF